MFWYLIRRILYMIPTVLGIIIITFVLFNVAGGDPALMKFGKQANARQMEDFDVDRGYDKPLLLGRWGKTRAYSDSDFKISAGPWKLVPGTTHSNATGSIILPAGAVYTIPTAFELNPSQDYRWEILCRLRPKARVPSQGSQPGTPIVDENPSVVITNASGNLTRILIQPGAGFQTLAVPFETGANTSGLKSLVATGGYDVEIKSIKLQRRTAHLFDSQLWFYLRQLAVLDFGVSQSTNQRVADMIRGGIMPSLSLMVPMFLVGLVLSITLALFCAFFRNTFIDRFFVVFSVVLMSVNYLVWIILGQFIMGYKLRWFPVWGYESAAYLVLPCLIGVISGLGSEVRFYRTIMLDEMYRDYVRTAFAKGVSRRGVLFKHVLKNAMIPILTGVVMEIPFLFTGSLLLESFFGIPGLGRLAITGIFSSDVDVIRAVVFIGAIIYVIANLITDICYALVDPRVRLK